MKRHLLFASYLLCLLCVSQIGCGDPEPTQTPEEVQQGHHQMHGAMQDAKKRYEGRRR